MSSATLTSKGQITIPAEVRAALRLVAGARLEFRREADGSYNVSRKSGHVRPLRGIIQYDGPPVSLEAMDQAIAEAVCERDLASRS